MVMNDSGRVVESNQYKAFGVKDYAYKERPQATGYIGKEKDSESNLADHGVRKYDADLGRFLCPDALWEKYISYTPYLYAGNDPVNKVDWNGKWVAEISKESDAHKGKIERNSNGYLADKINNDFYESWKEKAPAVASFVQNNSLFVMQKKLNENVMGEGEFGGNMSWFDLGKANSSKNLEGTALHEIIHNMGGNEFQAFSAQFAAGLISKTDLKDHFSNPNYLFGGVTKSFADKYFKEGYGRIDGEDIEEAINDMQEYGKEIIKEGVKK